MREKERYELRGIAVSLNTPFDENYHIDFQSLEKLIDLHLSEGAVGFLTTAHAAEAFDLTLDERIDLIRCVRDYTSGRAQVIAGTTARDERESLIAAEAAIKAGCDGVLIEVPEMHRKDLRATLGFCESSASLGMPMLMIQDLDWTGSGLAVDIITELFERIEVFKCLKIEVNPSGPKYSAVLKATGGHLHVSGGWASLQMLEALDRGVSVFMPSAMTGLFAQVMNCHQRGDREAARAWFHSTLPVLAFTRQHLDVSIHFHKRLFHRRGVFSTPNVRKRAIPYDAHHERCGEELIAYLDNIEKRAFG
ncbi:MAG: dihydrodipicolinate synthase family protein [Pyrinomonadaceae bacterium]